MADRSRELIFRPRKLSFWRKPVNIIIKACRWMKAHRPPFLLQLTYWAVVVVAFALLAYAIFTWLLNPLGVSPKKIDVTRMALTVAAGFGGLVALVVAYRKQRDTEEGRFVERFGAAAEQLGHTDVAVRMAGVYAMAGVADRTRDMDQRQQCIDVLCGYLRLPYDPGGIEDHQVLKIVRTPEREGTHPSREVHYQYRQNDRKSVKRSFGSSLTTCDVRMLKAGRIAVLILRMCILRERVSLPRTLPGKALGLMGRHSAVKGLGLPTRGSAVKAFGSTGQSSSGEIRCSTVRRSAGKARHSTG